MNVAGLAIWDRVLDRGWKIIRGLQALSRVLAHHGCGQGQFLLCSIEDLQGDMLWMHFLVEHMGRLSG